MDAAHVLIPMKAADGKSRLADAIPGSRLGLILLMLKSVVKAAREADVGPVTVVSASKMFAPDDVSWFDDSGLPWNEALARAMATIVTEPVAAVLSGDVPTATADEIRDLIAATPDRGMAIARAYDGGTNAVSMRPPGTVMTHFGEPQSAAVHAQTTAAAGLAARIIDLPGLAFDVDTPSDLERLNSVWPYEVLTLG